MRVLPVDIHQRVADELERARVDQRAVGSANVLPADRKLAIEREFVFFAIDALLLEHFKDGFASQERKRRLYARLFLAGFDEFTACAFAQHKIERFNNNGFSCAGFTRQHGKPTEERDRLMIDQRYVMDG